jgi:hypothetical protein
MQPATGFIDSFFKRITMKKLFFTLIILSAVTAANAQFDGGDVPTFELGVGADVAVPLRTLKISNSTGVGLTGKFSYNANEMIALSFQTGFLYFGGKSIDGFNNTDAKYPRLLAVPVKLGVAYSFPNGIYIEPQVGATKISKGIGTGFTYAGNIGYKMVPGLDVSARYESSSMNGNSFAFVGLRLAYTMGLVSF